MKMEDYELNKNLVGPTTGWCAKIKGGCAIVDFMKLLDFSYLPFQNLRLILRGGGVVCS